MKPLLLATCFVIIVCTVESQTKISRVVSSERGGYLANNVALCVQCHSPRNERGAVIGARAFDGAPIPFSKPNQLNVWAEFAPRIAGLPQYSEEQIITLLTTGIGREGTPLRAPMPTFKMSWQDAADVAVYLKSLRE
jgi:mono/diheme cytochrome c family protein